ncbi:MAG: NAD(P)/FAD-dependent oxidoreductase [Opitutales bacterium]|nr:NAD(P)/FAD-dependent oxidoreductase [Opitutales bacterium]MCH8541194.1 NAD(P)/FAD-dependent oxidoreductase [Opitutales bacterium]
MSKKKFDYDIITIGMGPAGMAVSAMGAAMGLKVCGIEKHKIGGECMNVGCIPSKSLLQFAKRRYSALQVEGLERAARDLQKRRMAPPFGKVREYVDFIGEKKTLGMFEKVELVVGQGAAEFTGPRSVKVGDREITARKIFLCAGTKPMMPPIEGLLNAEPLTNETMFNLQEIPSSLVVLGGGAIAVEMAQAFSRLGSKVTLVCRGERLLRRIIGEDATKVLEGNLEKEGITLLRKTKVKRVREEKNQSILELDNGKDLPTEQILVALGRSFALQDMGLDQAGIEWSPHIGVVVDKSLRTSNKNVFAVGDVNGFAQFSHAAMHQGMIALMNAMMPPLFKMDYRKFVIPWTVFTEPQVSHVGPWEKELEEQGVKYEKITVRYGDYGAAIAEEVPTGFATVYTNPAGKVHAVTIVGEGSGNMINEWALVVQKKIRLSSVLFLQHSFPTMGFLSKRLAETWMMKRMENARLRKIATAVFRLFNR